MFSKYLIIIFAISLPVILFGQENLPFTNDQYSGINAALVSPTQTFLNPNPWDINLFAEDVFLQNDYVYISQQSFLGLRNTPTRSRNKIKNINGENTASVVDFFNKDFGNYHFSSDILGPSFSKKIQIKDKYFTVGLFSRLRTQTSAINVDNYLKFGNQGIVEPEFYSLKPLQINFMNWGEIGLNVATEIFPYSDYQWIVGANVKYEIGFDALQVNSNSPIELHRTSEITNGVDTKTIYASNYDIEVNLATNYNFDKKRYEYKQKGKGFGLDFGIAVVDPIENSDDYNFKASLNILDLGKVNYDGEKHLFAGNSIKVVNNTNLDNTKFKSPDQYFQLLSKEVYGNENASFRGNDFQMGLPTSIHLNASKNVGEHQYVNADWIQRIPVFENSLKRSNVFSASYSVHKPVLGYGASMYLYEYRSLQFGGYLRFGPLILGSSNVLPLLFNQKKLHSGDFYIALKIYPFWDNEMKRHRRANCNCD
ncbi:hypothetical protein IV494_00830 [Kaistella sp. G5-32]|uniref:DUF5723 domain-containing protein n=1 Tax=Kaistella gelatinilytica TaxID=2787636 RepID=A0ABS0F7M0_9FLAO|nr:hypothetical protein [Kaistella gelatinilytica]MBF8455711.1 hypothetical protein [Kaistella gelatinilytica]